MDKLLEVMKSKVLTIPSYLLTNYQRLNITSDELIIIIYMLNLPSDILYDPNLFAHDLNIDKYKVMSLLSSLEEKKIISLAISKNKNNKQEEYVSLELLFQKLLNILLDNQKEIPNDNNICEVFENEFARTLSPMECEIIKGWINNGFSEEIIKEALKEATYNGVSNLRYIDKILYEWQKKNIKTKEDVLKDKAKYKKSSKEKTDVFDYNWLDE